MKDGVSARDAYQHAVSYVKSNMPDLEKNFVKSIGFGVISFTDIITPCTKIFLKDGHRISRCWLHPLGQKHALASKKYDI